MKRKPKVDEFKVNLLFIQNLMKKYKRIGVYGFQGTGVATILNKLEEKFTDWNFYRMGATPIEPFVYGFFEIVDYLPDFDVIYTPSYSDDYKEAVTGVKFTDGIWRPISEYVTVAEYKHMGSLDLRGKSVKSIDALKKLLKGEDVSEL